MGSTLSLVACFALLGSPDFQASLLESRQDGETLKTAGLPLTADGLHQFFAEQSTTGGELAVLRDKLDDSNFQVREKAMQELIRRGRAALPVLREAVKTGSEEMRRRALKCIERIDQQVNPETFQAAVRRLAWSQPEPVLPTLMTFLPHSRSDEVTDQIIDTLHRVMHYQGKLDPRVAAYLMDKDAGRRAAAAFLIAALSPAAERQALMKKLKDQPMQVRFQLARGLAMAGDRAALPVYLEVLERGPLPLAVLAQESLLGIAGEKGPQEMPLAAEGDRKAAHTGWTKWYTELGAKVALEPGGASIAAIKIQAKNIALAFFKVEDEAALKGLAKFPFFVADGSEEPRTMSLEEMQRNLRNDESRKMVLKGGTVLMLASFAKEAARNVRDESPIRGVDPGKINELLKKNLLRRSDFFVKLEMTYKDSRDIRAEFVSVVRVHGGRCHVVGLLLLKLHEK